MILSTAVRLSKKHGYSSVTRKDIADKLGISVNLITHYFGTMVKLRRHIMRAAIRDGVLEVIAQGLVSNDRHARKAPAELKDAAVQLLADR